MKKWSILLSLNHSPNAQHRLDSHPCQLSVILVNFFPILFYRPENFAYSTVLLHVMYSTNVRTSAKVHDI